MDILDEQCSAAGRCRPAGAKTIPAPSRPSPRFPAVGGVAWLLLLAAACTAEPRENGFHAAARARQRDGFARQSEARAHELQEHRTAVAEDDAALRQWRDRAAYAAQRRREAERAAVYEADQLRAEEAKLTALHSELAAHAAERDQLLAALAEVQQKELRLAALREQSAKLAQQVAEVEPQIAATTQHLDDLLHRLEQLKALGGEVDKLLQSLGALAPPPATPAPAATAPAAAPVPAPAPQATPAK